MFYNYFDYCFLFFGRYFRWFFFCIFFYKLLFILEGEQFLLFLSLGLGTLWMLFKATIAILMIEVAFIRIEKVKIFFQILWILKKDPLNKRKPYFLWACFAAPYHFGWFYNRQFIISLCICTFCSKTILRGKKIVKPLWYNNIGLFMDIKMALRSLVLCAPTTPLPHDAVWQDFFRLAIIF